MLYSIQHAKVTLNSFLLRFIKIKCKCNKLKKGQQICKNISFNVRNKYGQKSDVEPNDGKKHVIIVQHINHCTNHYNVYTKTKKEIKIKKHSRATNPTSSLRKKTQAFAVFGKQSSRY